MIQHCIPVDTIHLSCRQFISVVLDVKALSGLLSFPNVELNLSVRANTSTLVSIWKDVTDLPNSKESVP